MHNAQYVLSTAAVSLCSLLTSLDFAYVSHRNLESEKARVFTLVFIANGHELDRDLACV